MPVGDAAALAEAVDRVLTDSDRCAAYGCPRGVARRAASWDDGVSSARRWREWYATLPGMT